MYIIMCGDSPKVLVKTEADAQELVADLDIEFTTENFNWIMRVQNITIERALENVSRGIYWYRKVEVI